MVLTLFCLSRFALRLTSSYTGSSYFPKERKAEGIAAAAAAVCPLHTRWRKQIMFSGDTQLEFLLRAAWALNLSSQVMWSKRNKNSQTQNDAKSCSWFVWCSPHTVKSVYACNDHVYEYCTIYGYCMHCLNVTTVFIRQFPESLSLNGRVSITQNSIKYTCFKMLNLAFFFFCTNSAHKFAPWIDEQ